MTGSVLGVWVSSATKAKNKQTKNQTLRTFILQGRLIITITQKIIEFVQMC